jgi:hypothetical protein
VEWELRDDDNAKLAGGEKSLPEIGPPQSVEATWQPAKTKSLRLRLRLYRPTGFVAGEKVLDWWEPRSSGLEIEEIKREGKAVPQ